MKRIYKNTVLLCSLLCLMTLVACGQNPSKEGAKSHDPLLPDMRHLDSLRERVEESFPFVNYSANVIHFDSTSPTMNHLLDKWQQVAAGNGTLNIVHIGASHVQGGMMPHRIRCNILSAYPDRVGARGYIFPYSAAAKCNNPLDYKVHCKESVALTRCVYKEPEVALGVGGIAVTLHDSLASVQVVNNETRFDFRTQKVLPIGEWQADSGVVDECPYKLDIHLSPDSFEVQFPCDSVWSYNLRGFLLQGPSTGFTYHSIGVNGAAVPDYNRCPLFCHDLRLLQPDLVIFGIGINDASGPNFDTAVFRRNYLQLIDSIRSVNPRCAFIFITNNDSFKKVRRNRYNVNPNGQLACEVFYRLAEETGGAVWDQFEVMGGLKSMDKWRESKLAQPDRVHFTRAGYELIGDLFSEAWLKVVEADARRKMESSIQSTNQQYNRPPIPQY